MDTQDPVTALLKTLMDKDRNFSIAILENQIVLQLLVQTIETAKLAADIVGAPFMIFNDTIKVLRDCIEKNNHLSGV